MNVRFLGVNNVESRQSRMSSIVIDGVIALDAGGLTSSLSFRSQLRLGALFLTHQHYDHIRDVPALAMNFRERGRTIAIYSTLPVFDILKSRFFDGEIYPNFLESRDGVTTVDYHLMEPYTPNKVLGYTVEAIPVIHAVPAVGFLVTSPDGDSLFYTGDTGPGLFETWRHISPNMLIVEVTLPNRLGEHAREMGHLTPELLAGELATFKELRGYLPQVVAVHMNPAFEADISAELNELSVRTAADVSPARKGTEITLGAQLPHTQVP